MNGAYRYIFLLLLTAALMMPAAMMAARPQRAGVQVRVYDSRHKDYHNWDDNENRQWGLYLTQNNRRPHEYKRAKKSERRNTGIGAMTIQMITTEGSKVGISVEGA